MTKRMKANELMIGDWAMIKDYPMRSMPKKVMKEHLVSYLVEFEPIPLTEDILKANGINWSDRHCVFTDAHHFSFAKDLHFGRVYNMYGDNHHEVIMPFRFVHELQHALRLCGLNDLADNFKIKL